jgi:hypothetical protein
MKDQRWAGGVRGRSGPQGEREKKRLHPFNYTAGSRNHGAPAEHGDGGDQPGGIGGLGIEVEEERIVWRTLSCVGSRCCKSTKAAEPCTRS